MQAIRSETWRQPGERVAPNSYRGSATGPSGTATVIPSPCPLPKGARGQESHAQENHRVPSAGVSKGRLDLVGRAGQGATRLPGEPIRAMLRRSAKLVGFARRPGNQQFVWQYPSSRRQAGHRALVQSNGRGRDLWRRRVPGGRVSQLVNLEFRKFAYLAEPRSGACPHAVRKLRSCPRFHVCADHLSPFSKKIILAAERNFLSFSTGFQLWTGSAEILKVAGLISAPLTCSMSSSATRQFSHHNVKG